MVFCDGLSEKANVARRATEGEKSIIWPVTARPEIDLVVAGCAGCPKVGSSLSGPHHPCEDIGWATPYQETRHAAIAAGEKLRLEDAWKLQQAVWLWARCEHGQIFDTMLNVGIGQANNGSQQVNYEILSISETEENSGYWNRVQLRGPNPRRIAFSRSSSNPEWPLAGGRLLHANEECAIPPGATARFGWPSVLWGKVYPFIVKLAPPAHNEATADFWVEVSCDVRWAKDPQDLKYPPWDGKYYLDIFWYQLFPDVVGNWQVPRETQFTLQIVELTGVEVRALAGGIYTFKDTAGGDTRILYPGFMEEGSSFDLWVTRGGVRTRVEDWELAGKLATTQTGRGAWTSTIDLSGWQTEDVERVRLAFRPEAAAADDPWLMQFTSQCGHCQRDLSGSYADDGVDFCAAAADATAWGTFKQACWQPHCSRFVMGDETAAWEGGRWLRAASDARRSVYWAGLWSRCSWYVEQGIECLSEIRNFALHRPVDGGPSIGEILGGFCDVVPTGKFPTRWSYFGASAGMLESFTVSGGDPGLRIRTGAFWKAGLSDDPIDAWALEEGTIPAILGSTWDHKDALGATETDRGALPVGCGATGVYEYESDGRWLGQRTKLVEGMEFYAAGMNPGEASISPPDELTTWIRGLFE